jgi:hypothetical protein
LLANGTVDHSSPALTPHLKLFVVTYDRQIAQLGSPLVMKGVVDGASFWISGPSQRHIAGELSALVAKARAVTDRIDPHFPIFTGGYVTYSSIGWTEPGPFYECLDQSIEMYDRNQIQGFFVFAGSVLRNMNASLWKVWGLPSHLRSAYFPYQGGATVSVVDGKSGKPIEQAIATVVFNETTHVTRRQTSTKGQFSFGGWTGKARPATHTINVSAQSYVPAVAKVYLRAGEVISVTVKMHQH